MGESSAPPIHSVSGAGHLDPQAWLAAIIDSSDDAIVSKTLQGIVTTWNKAAERIFGYTAGEMVGKPILTIIPDDRQGEEFDILSRLRRGERIDHFETIRRRKDGSLIHVSVTISPVRDASGRIVGVSKIARDITQWKRIQRELTAAMESAEQARAVAERAQGEAESANRAKDHFLSILSHELRTPLMPALAAISFIEKDQSISPTLREQINMVRRNIETQARLVDDLLDLTKISRGKLSLHPEIVDAHSVIRGAVAMFQKEIDQKSLAVGTALRAKHHHVSADPGRFQQVLLNLMSNAVKFTPEQGSISLRTDNDADMLQIEIADDGIGIEPETIGRLFSPFEQGEQSFSRRFGGLGLGLSIVKSLVEMHGGSVTVNSLGKDKGATFTISLPTASPAKPNANPLDKAGIAQLPSNCRTLLVEDHADTRRVMGILLQSFGCSVTAAASVKEARELADQGPFDLLVCDFGLPDGSGADVMRHFRQHHPIKAIAITGFGQDEDLRRSKDAGFAVHLTKPVNIDALQRAIQEAVAG